MASKDTTKAAGVVLGCVPTGRVCSAIWARLDQAERRGRLSRGTGMGGGRMSTGVRSGSFQEGGTRGSLAEGWMCRGPKIMKIQKCKMIGFG